jgi:transposase
LWEEYRAVHPDGYGYSWFCDCFREWSGRLSPTMRQSHRAGERLFVDYAGQTVPIVDPQTGEVREAQIFIAVLGASNLTFAYPSWSQKLTDWIAAHVATFEALGEGVHSADVVLNILARRRPANEAITILTPDALKLRHEPIADCARYDALRRAG